ncbi:MAG: hypothetical protein Q9217_006104 [Psora testacea]
MNRMYLRLSVLHFCLVAADAGFLREQCYGRVTEILQSDNSSIAINPLIFISVSDPTNPILTLDGCQQLCGSGTGWYPDSGPRLVAWLLPIILLVSNMQFAPIGMERFLLILHLLGDPIDSTWSLLEKADSWSRCFTHAQKLMEEKIEIKSLAVIIAATEEFPHALDHALKFNAPDKKGLIMETARTLSENRRNEILRTLFAVAIYVFQVLAAFVPAVGAASRPSGGRIGTAMLLSWLLSVVPLSNAIGDFGSRRNCQRIVADFMERLGQSSDQDFCTQRTSTLTLSLIGVQKEVQTPHEASMAWSGAIYCYRPNKRFLHASGWKLALISVLPVAIGFGTAFAVLSTGPTYFNCRHILVIAVFSVWLISAISTSSLSWASFATGKYLWYIILIKDTVFAIATLALIVASSCGLWNTCYCWSGALVYGKGGARVELNPTKVFDRNNSVIYPAMVATCISFQICVFGAMLWVGGPGFRALWWSENEKRVASDLRRYPWVSSIATQTDAVKPQPPREFNDEDVEDTP